MLPDDPDTQARIFYLVLLLIFVTVGVFAHYRDRMTKAVQDAAIWVLIFVGVVLAIGFAEPLQRQLFQTGVDQIDAETVALRRRADGHYYGVLQINGADVEVLVDTGASDLVLTRRDARAAGLDTDALRYTIAANTANGRVMIAPVRLEDVRLGTFTDRNVQAMVSEGQLSQSLLGIGYLERFRAWYREGDRLYLQR